MADRIGQQLGNYSLARLLGRGGFAEVYLGEHLRLKSQAAIKVLHTSLEDDDVEGFLREAQTVARLKHPHIVRVFDFDVENHTPFLVMDYLPNGNIRRSHPKGTLLPLQTITSYVNQVASALQYAHNEKLIHRDIKPENMLLDRDNTLVLSDFGIALMAQSSRYQSTQEVAGTAAYMAPEQFQGKPRRASDQYALGIVVYEWLCGDRPFHGSFSEIASQHLFVPPLPLHEKVPTISPDVEQVVLTALAKDPHKRFASAQAFATALEQAFQSKQAFSSAQTLRATTLSPPAQPTKDTPPSTFSSPRRASSDKDVELPIVSMPEPLIASPSVPSQHSSADTPSILPSARSVVPPRRSLSKPTLAPSATSSTQPGISSTHRTSRRAVLVGLGLAGLAIAGGGLTWLALSQKSQVFSPSFRPTPSGPPIGTTLLTYRGHSLGLNAVAWSPDGKRIASGSYDKTVQIWDATTGHTLYTYDGHSDPVFAVAWSPDGKRIASGGGEPIACSACVHDLTVQVWDADTGGHVLTYRGHSDFVHSVAWSPNGERIASGSEDKSVQVWDAATGNHVLTYRGHSNPVYDVAWSPDGKYIASAGGDKTVQVWDAIMGNHILTYQGHSSNYVVTVAWSPDGKRVASGAYDSTAQVWDATTGNPILTYSNNLGYVIAVAWSPDGKYIASSSTDNQTTTKVEVWDATTANHIYTYSDPHNFGGPVAWSPDGKRIALGNGDPSRDTTVLVWQAA
jgi:serine/threonine protein kinase